MQGQQADLQAGTAPRPKATGWRFADFAPAGKRAGTAERPVVCVQGLGFVGAAMAAAVARARDGDGEACFNVLGVELETARGRAAVDRLNAGRFPQATSDEALAEAVAAAAEAGNLVATTDPAAYGLASVILVDVNLDLDPGLPHGELPALELDGFRAAIETVGARMAPGTLVIVETTVPPGTCEKVVAPILSAALAARGLGAEDFLLAHSYERVMPGADYLDSIVNYWRVYAGHTPAAAEACAAFLGKVVNVADYPPARLASTTASETAKVLENSYRAVNIAFMEEWGRFAEAVGVDLFEVVEAVRQRPSHSNLRQPGFGVGGYCLPKDPLLAAAAAREIFGLEGLDFPFCRLAVETNRAMPLVTLAAVERLLGGSLDGARILLLGVSYRPEVADTRFAPAEAFVEAAERKGASVLPHDPLVRHWPERDQAIPEALPDPGGADAVVFAVPHADYLALDLAAWFGAARPAVVDANRVLTPAQRNAAARLGCRFHSVGRGDHETGETPCAH
ncbi:MAG: nucleotide sugar dehydrogenase [Rhodospirillales bacterium]|nr:nucleotide sugar dehydrogenase [Rhodospirillales bacterium]